MQRKCFELDVWKKQKLQKLRGISIKSLQNLVTDVRYTFTALSNSIDWWIVTIWFYVGFSWNQLKTAQLSYNYSNK